MLHVSTVMRNDTRRTLPSVSRARCALVVRGETALISRLGAALAGEGFSTVVECRGADMIPAIERADGFDLAVVDGDATGAGALDLIAYLRHRMPATPILFLAAADAALLAEAARARGATGCLTKPVEPAAAVAAVRASMSGAAPRGDERTLVQAGPARPARGSEHLWGVVLAGGEGRRLRPLVRHVHGDLRPKQYARLVGTRSLLEQTLDRVALLVPRERTVLISVRRHRRYLDEALGGRAMTVLAQPADRGTAAGVLLPVQWVERREPGATVAIFPSDHFVLHERRFMAHVADAVAFVEAHPTRIVLVGAEPSGPETEYGWIEPGELLSRIGPTPISTVARFVEKPSPAGARACLSAGALWNTFVVVARATTLADATRQVLPVVHDALAAVVPVLGTGWGVAALRRAYAGLPTASFSTEVLERCAPLLAVSRLAGTTWCDWGSPRRVIRTLRQTGQQPDWLETFTAGRLA
jgi:mannose-1-phosphate guanylyltransferase/DNA-binding NarL/FixJ family response regulator